MSSTGFENDSDFLPGLALNPVVWSDIAQLSEDYRDTAGRGVFGLFGGSLAFP